MAFRAENIKVDAIIKDIDKPEGAYKKLYMDFANQRVAGIWSKEQQSLLVHSAIINDLIPEILILENGVSGLQPNTLIDGKQRISTLYLYYNNGFALHKNTPDVEMVVAETDDNGNVVLDESGKPVEKNITVKIAGKRFKKLPKELQARFLDYNLAVRLMYNCTADDVARQMFKVNNGKAMTSAQRAITRLGITLGAEIKKITNNDFFEDRIALTASEIKASENMKRVLQALILYTNKSFNKLNNNDMNRLAEEFANDWSQADLDRLNDLFLQLNYLLPDNQLVQKYLTTTNIPILIMNVEKYEAMAADGEITETQYREFLRYWFTEGIHSELYTQYDGRSVSDKTNVEGRIDTMEIALLKFLMGEKLPLFADNTVDTFETYFISDEHIDFEKWLVKSMMVTSEYHFGDLTDHTVNDYIKYVMTLSVGERKEITDNVFRCLDCWWSAIDSTNINTELLFGEYLLNENTLCFLHTISKALRDNVDYDRVAAWTEEFITNYNTDGEYAKVRDDQVSYIMGRISILYSNFEEFEIKMKEMEEMTNGIISENKGQAATANNNTDLLSA